MQCRIRLHGSGVPQSVCHDVADFDIADEACMCSGSDTLLEEARVGGEEKDIGGVDVSL
jgi:hypothetical protein